MRRKSSLTPFFIVSADLHPCPYLPGQTACTPLRWPRQTLSPTEFDQLLAEGDRRAGPVLYRTECPSCSACEPLRIPVGRFVPTKSQRRALRRNEDLRIAVGPAVATQDRVDLYNNHRDERGLANGEPTIDLAEYHLQYVESCVDTREVTYWAGDRLVAVSIVDVGKQAASSVYHFFDPAESRRSIGVFSVLREIDLCREWGVELYYMGLWVERCSHLSYKSGYFPHQRRRAGVWHEHGPVEAVGPVSLGGN